MKEKNKKDKTKIIPCGILYMYRIFKSIQERKEKEKEMKMRGIYNVQRWMEGGKRDKWIHVKGIGG